MKRSDTLFRHKQTLLYETGASIREMVYKITAKINSPTFDFREYEKMGVCERVGTWIADNDGQYGAWGLFTIVQRYTGNGEIHFTAETPYDDYLREDEMYYFTLDELIYLHDEIEKIYKYEMKKKED